VKYEYLKSFYRIAKTNLMFNAFGSKKAKPVIYACHAIANTTRKAVFIVTLCIQY